MACAATASAACPGPGSGWAAGDSGGNGGWHSATAPSAAVNVTVVPLSSRHTDPEP